MKLHITNDVEELSKYVADWLVNYIQEVLFNHHRFTIALSGGSTPKKLYQLLATEEYKNKIDWKRMHFFWGDERYVPFTDDSNNAKMAFENLLSLVPVRKENIHIMQTGIDPESAAVSYEKILHNYFDKQLYTFDLVLLGLGDNSHTLSLFPGYDTIIFEKEKRVTSFYLEEQKMYRITLTAAVVNNAACIAFLVTGKDKSPALQQIISGKYDPSLYPAQIIKTIERRAILVS
ncbi:MAG: 6-phosphogluconolactonase [Chitinophagaceae bacterium]